MKIEPNHYWKFREGSGDYAYDLGSDHINQLDLNLPINSTWREPRGVKFNKSNYINSNSYLLNTGNGHNFCIRVIGKFEFEFNEFFPGNGDPSLSIATDWGIYMKVITIVKQMSTFTGVDYIDFTLEINPNRSIAFGRDPNTDGVITWTISDPGVLNDRLNEIMVITSYINFTKIYLNGVEVATSNSGGINVNSSPCAYFFDRMIGDINLLATYEKIMFTEAQIKLLSRLRYDVPRTGRWIDFSDQFDSKGRNLLQDLSDIQRIIEKGEGQFYYKVGSVKVSNE